MNVYATAFAYTPNNEPLYLQYGSIPASDAYEVAQQLTNATTSNTAPHHHPGYADPREEYYRVANAAAAAATGGSARGYDYEAQLRSKADFERADRAAAAHGAMHAATVPPSSNEPTTTTTPAPGTQMATTTTQAPLQMMSRTTTNGQEPMDGRMNTDTREEWERGQTTTVVQGHRRSGSASPVRAGAILSAMRTRREDGMANGVKVVSVTEGEGEGRTNVANGVGEHALADGAPGVRVSGGKIEDVEDDDDDEDDEDDDEDEDEEEEEEDADENENGKNGRDADTDEDGIGGRSGVLRGGGRTVKRWSDGSGRGEAEKTERSGGGSGGGTDGGGGMEEGNGRRARVSGGRVRKKASRMVWSEELHTKFLSAVEKLGVDDAVPTTILQIMNVDGLTRENVASHLQKHRGTLKKQREEEKKSSMLLALKNMISEETGEDVSAMTDDMVLRVAMRDSGGGGGGGGARKRRSGSGGVGVGVGVGVRAAVGDSDGGGETEGTRRSRSN